MEKKFVEGRFNVRRDSAKEIEVRIISDDVVVYSKLDLNKMKIFRDFLNQQIEKMESEEDGSI